MSYHPIGKSTSAQLSQCNCNYMIHVDYEYYVRFSIHSPVCILRRRKCIQAVRLPIETKKLIAVVINGKFSVTQSLLLLFHRSSQCALIITFDLQSWIMVHIANPAYISYIASTDSILEQFGLTKERKYLLKSFHHLLI